MGDLNYTNVEYRKDEDGNREKYVYVPEMDEWMTEDQFYFEKSCYDPAMKEAHEHWNEHSTDDIYDDDEYDDDDDEYDDEFDDSERYGHMTREEAMEEYERTGINRSNYDLNDWDEINRRLGYEFFKPRKR